MILVDSVVRGRILGPITEYNWRKQKIRAGMKSSTFVVFWAGEAVGEMSEVRTETFHLSGLSAPRDSPGVQTS